jgi:hypothetical protein
VCIYAQKTVFLVTLYSAVVKIYCYYITERTVACFGTNMSPSSC